MVKNGWVKICDNSVIVKDPVGNGKFARITPSQICKLYINGVQKDTTTIVKEEDNVFLELKEKNVVRNVKVVLSTDKMKAFLTIEYEKGIIYKIEDTKEEENLILTAKEDIINEPTLFSEKEILEVLRLSEVIYGINFDKINEITKSVDVNDILVAEGIYSQEAKDDSIQFLHNKNEVIEETKAIYDVVDYKNLNKIDSVSAGTIIGEIKRGHDGQWGKNILGETVIPKREFCKKIICGEGCVIKENYIIATIDGQVTFKKNKVTVNKVYKVLSDVDISTGNIKFHGDITINGNVKEGMYVCAQNNIKILGGVFSGNVISRGNTEVLGNIMNSKLAAGGKDIIKEARLKSLNKLEEVLEELLNTIEYLRNRNILTDKQSLGLIVKGLIDTKFTSFNKLTMEVVSDILKDGDKKSEVLRFIKSKLMGIAILRIDKIAELAEGLETIKEEIEILKQEEAIQAFIKVNYCQDSFIQCTGDIEITGKGTFASEFYSDGHVVFKDSSSVCRGGKITAKDYIKAGTVGSEGAVQTVLELQDKSGVIEIEKAYNNTLIIIGNKQSFINIPSKQIKCYIDNEGELIIEKFVL